MKPLSMRWKIGIWSASLAVIVLVIFCAATFLNLYDEQIEAVDLDMEAAAKNIAAECIDNAPPSRDQLRGVQPWITLAVFDAKGTLIAASEGLPDELARIPLNHRRPTTINFGVRSLRVGAYPAKGHTLTVIYDLDEVHDIVSDLVTSYLLSTPLVMLIAAAGGWWLSGRVLRPVRELAAAAQNIDAGKLAARAPVPEANDEFRCLALALNSMLDRLERSFLQADRFAADASHELRTPLTIMRGEIDRLLHSPGLLPSHEERLLSLQEEISRLGSLTESLLLLARLDSGKFPPPAERVDLSALATEVCEDGSLLAERSALVFENRIQSGVFVTGDTRQLHRVALNLLDNACRHNTRGGRVLCTLSLSADGTGAELAVSNTGPEIPRELRHRLFERFFRVDDARSGNGHGLGLSLGREIALAHRGTLELRDTSDGLTCFVLSLPIATPLTKA